MKKHIHESNLIEGYDDPEFDAAVEEILAEKNHVNLVDTNVVVTVITEAMAEERPYLERENK
jgi:hypothetical protein